MAESKSEFLKWHYSFYDSKSRNSLPNTEVVGKWYERCETVHHSIREFLGGIRRITPVDISTEPNPSVPIERINEEATTLHKLIPEYFLRYNIGNSNLLNIKNRLRYPVVGEKPFEKYPWGKHIKTWISKHNKKTPEGLKKVASEKEREISILLSKMGQIWSESVLQTTKMYLNVTTSPEAFMCIGNYGIDKDSCFKPGGINEIHRYVLGESPNTFVGLVSKFDEIEKENNSNILTRFWGILDENHQSVYISNIYPKTPENGGTILRCIQEGFRKLLFPEGGKTKVVNDYFKVTGVYFNNDGRTHALETFPLNKDKKIIFLKPETTKPWQKCVRCDNRRGGQNWESVDSTEVCSTCFSVAKLCYISGEYTFTSCFNLKSREGISAFGKTFLIEKNPEWKYIGGLYYHKDDLVKYNGKEMSKWDMDILVRQEEDRIKRDEDLKNKIKTKPKYEFSIDLNAKSKFPYDPDPIDPNDWIEDENN